MASLDIKDLQKEYIHDYSSSMISAITKTACAFLNTCGGTIFLRISQQNDSSKDPTKVIDKVLDYWENNICIISENNLSNLNRSLVKTHFDNKDLDGNVLIFFTLNSVYQKSTYSFYKNSRNEEEIYIRNGANNIITDVTHLAYIRLTALNVFPFIKDYTPRLLAEKEEFNYMKKKNQVELKTIGELRNDKSNRIFKHLDLEAALLSMTNGNMRFYEPSNWDDDYECRFYNATYIERANPIDKKKTPFLYATCFASKPNNEAAWVLYSHNQTGLASRCVQFELNLKELRKQLVKNAKKKMIYFGEVNYVSAYMINHLHESIIDGRKNKYYQAYFDNFSLECYLNLLLLKRTIFEHEKEIRLFIIPNPRTKDSKNKKTRKTGKKTYEGNSKPLFTEIKIDWSEVIEKVRIDKDSTLYEKSILQKELNKLYKKRLKKAKTNGVEFDEKKEKAKFTLSPFDPYEDKSLTKGPISIVTN